MYNLGILKLEVNDKNLYGNINVFMKIYYIYKFINVFWNKFGM